MALEADFRLDRRHELVLGRDVAHDRMATGAGEAARLVRAAFPGRPFAAFVAGEANAVRLFDLLGRGLRAEIHHAAHAAAAAGGDVLGARAVAVLAFHRALARGLADPSHQRGAEFGRDCRVAGHAFVRADEIGVAFAALVLAFHRRLCRLDGCLFWLRRLARDLHGRVGIDDPREIEQCRIGLVLRGHGGRRGLRALEIHVAGELAQGVVGGILRVCRGRLRKGKHGGAGENGCKCDQILGDQMSDGCIHILRLRLRRRAERIDTLFHRSPPQATRKTVRRLTF